MLLTIIIYRRLLLLFLFLLSLGLVIYTNSTLPISNNSPQVQVINSTPARTLYKHFEYREAKANTLIEAGFYIRDGYSRPELLAKEAKESWHKMVIAAKDEGVNLIPISGFRSIKDQKVLWVNQVKRRGSEKEAAKRSAPPGFSEHHTGYAIDIADIDTPSSDLNSSFDQTPSYQWLSKNARQFGWENSFPVNNKQGISYEPWHWRYVGTSEGKRIFKSGREKYPV